MYSRIHGVGFSIFLCSAPDPCVIEEKLLATLDRSIAPRKGRQWNLALHLLFRSMPLERLQPDFVSLQAAMVSCRDHWPKAGGTAETLGPRPSR